MRIVVFVKQIGYVYHPLAIESVGGVIDPEKMVYMLNPYDESALEEAIQIKERFPGCEVIIITAGPPRDEEALRYAFAFGADRMIRINTESLVPWSIASLLVEVIRNLNLDIILCGKRATDTNDNQVPTLVAELLNLVQVSGIISLEPFPKEEKAMVERYLGKGDREEIECKLPALFTVEKGLNDPRYPTLPNRLLAEKHEIEVIEESSLGARLDNVPDLSVSAQLTPPRPKPKKAFTPDTHLSPGERLKLIMSGGAADKKSDLIEGIPEELANKIMEVLIQEKVI